MGVRSAPSPPFPFLCSAVFGFGRIGRAGQRQGGHACLDRDVRADEALARGETIEVALMLIHVAAEPFPQLPRLCLVERLAIDTGG